MAVYTCRQTSSDHLSCWPRLHRRRKAETVDYWLAVMFEDNSQLLDIARAAEELGFAGIAVADHIAVPHGFTSVHPSGETFPFAGDSGIPAYRGEPVLRRTELVEQ